MICDMQEERYEKKCPCVASAYCCMAYIHSLNSLFDLIFFFIHFKLIAFEWKFRIGTQMYTLYTYYTYYTTLMSA